MLQALISPAGLLAGGLVASLTTMIAIRKIGGPDVAEGLLVGHRTDIGLAAGLSIGLSLLAVSGFDEFLGFELLTLSPCGSKHLVVILPSQVLYAKSIVARGDVPPEHPVRAMLLTVIWMGFLFSFDACKDSGTGDMSPGVLSMVALEVASLWVVKLKLGGTKVAKKGR